MYEALMDRFKLLFEEFDNIYVSFSGGKDSGLLLNLVLDYRNKYYPEKSIGVFHQDFEAQYTVTTEYIEKTFEKIKDKDEILRLKQITGLAALFKDVKFGKAWVPVEEDDRF